jgi:hypothetical protein
METRSLQLDKASPKADVINRRNKLRQQSFLDATVMATHDFSKHLAAQALWGSTSLHERAVRSCPVHLVA